MIVAAADFLSCCIWCLPFCPIKARPAKPGLVSGQSESPCSTAYAGHCRLQALRRCLGSNSISTAVNVHHVHHTRPGQRSLNKEIPLCVTVSMSFQVVVKGVRIVHCPANKTRFDKRDLSLTRPLSRKGQRSDSIYSSSRPLWSEHHSAHRTHCTLHTLTFKHCSETSQTRSPIAWYITGGMGGGQWILPFMCVVLVASIIGMWYMSHRMFRQQPGDEEQGRPRRYNIPRRSVSLETLPRYSPTSSAAPLLPGVPPPAYIPGAAPPAYTPETK